MKSLTRNVMVLVPGTLLAVACATSEGPTAAVRATDAASTVPSTGWTPDVVTLCKIAPVNSFATFDVSATGGSLLLGGTTTIQMTEPAAEPFDDANHIRCVAVWQATGASTEQVTIRETGTTAGLSLQQITTVSDGNWNIYMAPVVQATVSASPTSNAAMWFKNFGVPSESDGADGCTPGYWKQSHHFDSWPAAYTPGQSFASVGFADVFPGKTLLQVLSSGGGGLTALGRHTVAALLNSGNASVEYGQTPAAVIAAFNAAVASGSYDAQKNIFEGWNERGCPLN